MPASTALSVFPIALYSFASWFSEPLTALGAERAALANAPPMVLNTFPLYEPGVRSVDKLDRSSWTPRRLLHALVVEDAAPAGLVPQPSAVAPDRTRVIASTHANLVPTVFRDPSTLPTIA